ncbi:RNA methyltransferase [Neisseria leonii]|uniref:RNA methyltransferase n=1 Tax=Neisseria leonii TaxID=2995413 RepID=A0A9X4E0R5_9NEIS|nr:RNA methyltransferase [Neisseria sp. 51.81]MDD9327367.1 RNA methyltransferase [Neisseria sp. 51.81]
MKHITSAQNTALKRLAKLAASGKARRADGLAVLEGEHLLEMYLDSGGVPLQCWLPEAKQDKDAVRRLTARLGGQTEVLTAADGLLAKVGGLAQGEDLITLITQPRPSAACTDGTCVVLDRVQDPGNVGTILRSAAAAGVRRVILSADSADVWSPKVLRSGMGAHFLLDIDANCRDLAAWRQGYRRAVYAAALTDNNHYSLYDMNLTEPCAWIFGNEGSGVSTAVLALADAAVRIPMAAGTESLNVAMAATVCLFEQMRQQAV